jgi:type IV pilus assembly protein PilP
MAAGNAEVLKPKLSSNAMLSKKTQADSQTTQTNAMVAMGASAAPAAELLEEVGYFYDSEGKIDPFVPLIKEEPVVRPGKMKPKKNKDHIPGPLEKIELSQLNLVGVIRTAKGSQALLEEASGKGYIVNSGTYIGIHGGKIIEIKKDRILVEEEFEDITGKNSVRHRELKLQKTPGEL